MTRSTHKRTNWNSRLSRPSKLVMASIIELTQLKNIEKVICSFTIYLCLFYVDSKEEEVEQDKLVTVVS